MVERRELLLVEDDAVTRELLTLLLTGEGWQVHTTETGEEALAWLDAHVAGRLANAPMKVASAEDERVEAERVASGSIALEPGVTGFGMRPDVVLCDQKLPGICGVGLARKVRARLAALGGGGRTVVLAMSATVSAQELEGYDGFLSKPFAASAVERLWREVLLRTEDRYGRTDGSDAVDDRCATLAPGALAADEVGDMPVLDGTVFAKLQSSMGAPALKSLYGFALADAGDRVRRMDVAYQTGDREKYVEEAHALKGSSGMIGARRLREMAAEAEQAGLERDGRKRTGTQSERPFSLTPLKSASGSTKDGGSAMVESREEAAVMRSKQIRSAIADIRLMLEALFPL